MGTTIHQPPPDPAIGEASHEAIQLGRDQFDAQQKLLAEYSPLFKQQIQTSLDQQQKNNARSDTQWQQYTDNFMPVEQKFAQTALNYDTPERQAKAAADAAAGISGAFDQTRQGLTESLQAQGLSGSSGKGLALQNASRIEEAKAAGGAEAAARRSVETTGLNLVGSAANFGRNLPNTGLSAGAAGAAGGAAATGNVSGLSGLTGAGFNANLQGYGVGINGLLGQYQGQMQAGNANRGIFGDLLGAGLSAYGMYSSSKKLKTDKGTAVSGKKALAGLSDLVNEHWAYKKGAGDEGAHVGPYAEDVQHRFGDKVAPGGKVIDMHAMMATNAKAIGQLARELKGVMTSIKQLEAA